MAHEPAIRSGPPEPPLEELALGDVLRQAAADAGDRPALIEGIADRDARRRWTYAELLADAERCGRALLARYAPGDRVAIWAPNVPEYQLLQYGAALAGLTLVTVNPTFRPDEARYVLERSGAVACFTVSGFRNRTPLPVAQELAGELESLRDVVDLEDWEGFLGEGDPDTTFPAVDPRSPALVLYTSGTTGAPKGAMLPHLGMTNNVRDAAHVLLPDPTDPVWLIALPMFHLAGVVVADVGSLALRGAVLPMRDFDAGLALRLLAEERVTTTNLVSTMMLAMLQHPAFEPAALRSLRSVMLGGGPVPASLAERLEAEFGITTIVGYGMTEAACISWTSAGDEASLRTSTCGRALPRLDIRIADPRTNAVREVGEVGELQTRGDHVMLGYLDDPAATAEAFAPGGWLKTGDLGTMDEAGYVRISGRAREMIIRGGENIYPREVEDELHREDEVAEAAVVGLPDDYYGEVVAAFVRLREGRSATPGELAGRLQERLTGAKVPSRWFFVDEHPKTPSGKIKKHELKALWEQGRYEETAR